MPPLSPSNAVTEASANLVAGRECGTCTMCCKMFEIPSIAKAAGEWCPDCAIGKGCTVYETRPTECRDFFCHYRLDRDVPEHWKPERSGMVMKSDAAGTCITVYVDRKTPQRWREMPYYRDLKAWSANRLTANRFLHVRIGLRIFVILPDRDVDLGNAGDKPVIARRNGAALSFEVVEKEDPRVAPPVLRA